MVFDPEGIVDAIVDETDQPLPLGDGRQPRRLGRLGATVNGLDADPQSAVERELHRAVLQSGALRQRACGNMLSAGRSGVNWTSGGAAMDAIEKASAGSARLLTRL